MICHKHKAIFVHIPKTGGSSIESAFGFTFHDFSDGGKHHPPDAVIRAVGRETWDDYFKFTFVRNPWDRMVSWLFFTMTRSPNVEGVKTLEEVLGLHARGYVFGPHSVWLDGFEFDFIGRYERLEDDFRKVCCLIGADLRLPWDNKTEHGHYSEYYSSETQAVVADREQSVIEQFAYSFESAGQVNLGLPTPFKCYL